MPDVFVAVPFVKQETLFYCGPATLQMLLTSLGVASPATPPSWQEALWAEVEANTGAVRPPGAPSTPTAPYFPTQKCESCGSTVGWKCWSTTPDVLEDLANAHQSVARYSISTHVGESTATGVLMDTIDANLPGVVLIRGWQHWVAIDGYLHSEPGATAVAGRNLNGVYIRDPWTSAATHYVDWSTWKVSYLKIVPCGAYAGTMVAIGGVRLGSPAPPARPAPRAPTGLRIIDPLDDPLRFSTREVKMIVSPALAIEHAQQGVTGLAGAARLRPGFDAARATKALLVQRLDGHDRYYYIVTFEAGDRETARVIVEADDGRVTEVQAVQETGQSLAPYPTADSGRRRLVAAVEGLSPPLHYRIREGTVGEHPVPVWKPCGQSSSPFLPFWQYSVGDSFVYYRFDGLRFDELTEGPA